MAYIFLALAGLLPTAWIICTRRKAALGATFFFGGALVMLADWIAFGWFQLYSYHPHLSRNPIVDNMLGELLAETLFIAGLCVMLETYLPGWRGAVAGTLIATGLEWLFLRWGLFSHHGWRIWMTAAGFPFYFLIVSRFAQQALTKGLDRGRRRTAARMGIAVWLTAILTAGLRMGGLVQTNISLFPTFMGNQSFGRFVTYLPVIVPLTGWILRAEGPDRFRRLVLSTLVPMGLNILMVATHFQTYRPPWSPTIDGLAQGATMGLAILLDHWLITNLRSSRNQVAT